jgi:hypothetical protein
MPGKVELNIIADTRDTEQLDQLIARFSQL